MTTPKDASASHGRPGKGNEPGKRMGRPVRPITAAIAADNAVARFRAARPGLSQAALGELTGYTDASVSRMESGAQPISRRMLAMLNLLEQTLPPGQF